ncbi:MAG: glucosyl-3-phosphoglycerate synthase [Thermoleophilaceae bacterium]|nr:glucosyl-3-phosphoglycerate synthase [Thermoleophilaceae bacterium]
MRSHHHGEYPARGRAAGVSVVLPARECADTIEPIVAACVPLAEQVVVIDAASRDGTAELAARAGAEVHQEAELMADFGPPAGKGDAMWRSLSVVRGEIVAFVDADTEGFDDRFVRGLTGPLLAEPAVQYVKGFYRRPFKVADATLPEGGGRVTELTARPLLRAFYPELADVRQPLAGEVAARRELLERLPFATGYSVEIAMLIDAWAAVGLDGIAQVDLDVRQNRHQPLGELAGMADAVLAAVTERLVREGRLRERPGGRAALERPPMASVMPARQDG